MLSAPLQPPETAQEEQHQVCVGRVLPLILDFCFYFRQLAGTAHEIGDCPGQNRTYTLAIVDTHQDHPPCCFPLLP